MAGVLSSLRYLLADFIGDDETLRAFFAERVRYYFKDIRGFA